MKPEHLATSVLQIVRLKGRLQPAALAESLGLTPETAQAQLEAWLAVGAVVEAKGNYRISPAGREQLARRIELERADADSQPLESAYQRFHHLNTEFKALVTDWQLRAGQPNDHADADYDRQIVARLVDLDGRWQPLLAQMQALAPRLSPYSRRFAGALHKIGAGDAAWVARPVIDSYHTVWFELHEDLIGLLGLSREAEAALGRAE